MSEHKEIDDFLGELVEADPSSEQWAKTFKELRHRYLHSGVYGLVRWRTHVLCVLVCMPIACGFGMFLARAASASGHAAPRDWWASRSIHNKNQEISMSLTAPSHAQSCDRIRSNPKFQQLVRRRSRLSWSLSAAVLGTYYSFMLVVAFAPQWLHAPLSQGGMLSSPTTTLPPGLVTRTISAKAF